MLLGRGRLSSIMPTPRAMEIPTPLSLPLSTSLISHPLCPLLPIKIPRIIHLNLLILLNSSNNKQHYPPLLVLSNLMHQVKAFHRALQPATVVFMRCRLVYRVLATARQGSGHQARITQGRARARGWTCSADSRTLLLHLLPTIPPRLPILVQVSRPISPTL